MKKELILGVTYLLGVCLFILGTMFIQWDNFNPSEWEAVDRAFWLIFCLLGSSFPMLGVSMYFVGKDI